MSLLKGLTKKAGALITFLIISFAGLFIADSKSVVEFIAAPIVWVAHLLPDKTTPDAWKITYAISCLLIYLLLAVGILQYIVGLMGRRAHDHDSPPTAYSAEIATAIEYLDRPRIPDLLIHNTLDDLLRGMALNICESFPSMSHRDIRYSFIVRDDNGDILMVRLGNHLSLKEGDVEAVEWALSSFEDTYILEPLPENNRHPYDMKAIGLVRNAGSVFKFGFTILLPSDKIINDRTRHQFFAATAAIPLLSYMDKLMPHVVKYSLKMEGGRV